MNKDVIYIEPEDDITDIILKIENSKEKIVALVPPKKAGVFRSIVNIKLMAKTATTAKKKIVLVTTDPSIKKIAASVKLLVTKNLQSAPTIPVIDDNDEETSSEEVFEKSEDEDTENQSTTESENTEEDENNKDTEDTNKASEKDEGGVTEDEQDVDPSDTADTKTTTKKTHHDNSTKSIKPKLSGAGLLGWLKDNKKLAVVLGVCGILLVLFLIWALVIAPAVSIQIDIRTNSNNFSENVTFTTNLNEENADEGKFYLEERKIESTQEVKFEATGKKNIGEKATGNLIISKYFDIKSDGGTIPISAGTIFTINGLSYKANSDSTIYWDGNVSEAKQDCENYDRPSWKSEGCLISTKISVTAAEPGSKYNISASLTGWSTVLNVKVSSVENMSGGTDEEIAIVTQADIDKAKATLADSTPEDTKNKKDLLYSEQTSDTDLVIESSFKQTTNDATPTPAANEEVKEGVTPILKATTKVSVYVVDKTKIEQFITKKAELGDTKRIYEMKKPFIESFMESSSGYAGKLKTSYAVGPRITENDVIEKIKGKGLGEAQHDLKDIEGIDVRIDKSVPWVSTVPADPNKITIIFEVKDQNGGKIEMRDDDNSEKDEDDQEPQDSNQENATAE